MATRDAIDGSALALALKVRWPTVRLSGSFTIRLRAVIGASGAAGYHVAAVWFLTGDNSDGTRAERFAPAVQGLTVRPHHRETSIREVGIFFQEEEAQPARSRAS